MKMHGKKWGRKMKTNIPIWGDNIPGNNTDSKLKEMSIGKKGTDFWMMIKAAVAMPGVKIKNASKAKLGLDTYQYYHEIASGFRPDTYEDVPCIDYYPCEASKAAILIIPGGGYTYQSNSGVEPQEQYEGGALAMELNEAGYTAFVLSRYRLNPYRMPIPLLDAQRAMRFIRFHASDFNIDPDKLGIMGFSAGGLQTAGCINICRNRSVREILDSYGMKDVNYQPDEIDNIECKAGFAGLIYPMLSFRANVPMMYAAFPQDKVDDDTAREVLLKQYDVTEYVQPGDVPQFIVMGTKDTMVDLTDDKSRYMKALQEAGVKYHYLPVEGAGHGFGVNNKKFHYWVQAYIDWLQELKLQ